MGLSRSSNALPTKKHLQAIRSVCIKNGNDPKAWTLSQGDTALHFIVRKASGPQANGFYNRNNSAQMDPNTVAVALIEHGIDIYAADFKGQTALHLVR